MNKRYHTFLLIFLVSGIVFGQKQSSYTNIESHWFEGDLAAVKTLLNGSADIIDNYNLAVADMLSGNYSKAIRMANKMATQNPQWSNYLLSNIYYLQKEYTKAQPLFEKYLAENSNDFYALLDLGKIYISNKQYEKARIFLVEKVDEFEDERLYDLIAETYILENKLDDALKWLLEAEKLYPDFNVLWHMIQVFNQTNNSARLYEYGIKLKTMFSGSSREPELAKIFEEKGMSFDFKKIDNSIKDPVVLSIGEKLKYDVEYGFIYLGEVSIQVLDTVKYRENDCYLIEYRAQTATGLPFFSMHNRYVAYQDRKSLIGYKSLVFMDESNEFNRNAYIMDYKKQKLHIYRIRPDGRIRYTVRSLPNSAVDAMALLFYARNLIKNKKSMTVSTIIDDRFRTTDIFYKNEKSRIDILNQTAISEEVYAKANFTGLAGMTGDVWGWFIDAENACVPAIGKARIFLGSVTLTLVKWRP